MVYKHELQKARQDTQRAFLSADCIYPKLVDVICELTFQSVLEIEKSIQLTKYYRSLLASFARSTVVSVELIATSELIEAVAILRKQVELLARLNELEFKTVDELTGRTPNVGSLKTNLKQLYSRFSEGVHSSTYGSMALLGFYENRGRRAHLLYPEFTENTEIIFQNWLFVFFEFSLWIMAFKNSHVIDYDQSDDEQKFQQVMTLYKQSDLERKFKGHRSI